MDFSVYFHIVLITNTGIDRVNFQIQILICKYTSLNHLLFFNILSIYRLYKEGHPKKIEKLKCIFNYFRRVTEKSECAVILSLP